MKKIMLTIGLCIPAMLFAQDQAFSLKIKVDKVPAAARAYISYTVNGTHILDSVNVKNGQFEFKGKLSEPVQAKLMLDHQGAGQENVGANPDMTSLFLENGTITMQSPDSLKHAEIKGSPLNKEHKRYEQFLDAPKLLMSKINEEYELATEDTKKDPAFMKGLELRFRKAFEDRKVLQKEFVKTNPNSYFSLIALEESAGKKLDMAEAETLYNSLSAPLRDSRLGKEFAARILAAKQ